MKAVWWNESIDTGKTTIIHAGIFCGILFLFVMCGRIFKINAHQIYMMVSELPDSLIAPVDFLQKSEVADPARCLLLAESVLNVPVLFYAALLPTRMIGEENENGTMAFICNGPFGRKDIFSGKLMACCTNYTMVVTAMFLTGAVTAAPGVDFFGSLMICARVFVMLLVTGLSLIHISALYCAAKSAHTCSGGRIFVCMLLNTVMGYFYLILTTAKDVAEAKGKIVVLNKAADLMFYALQRISAVQICAPEEIYVKIPWALVALMLSLLIIIGTLSGVIYEKRDFGWD
ncbi:MAG: ABC transporter permease [Alistipes sp.]|nr:ABC transporter permease [Alistipes sp.]